jgi:nitronate monooxygenase
MDTAFTRLLSIQAPLIQAPIGRSAGPALVAAVSNAGAIGSLTIWTMPVTQVASTVAATAKLTNKPFAVNVRADLKQHDRVAVALQGGASLIHLFWGDPTSYVGAIHRAGAKVIAAVGSADEAKQALDAGADVLIAQGWEAGGHLQGTVATLCLVPAVVDLAGSVPVLAAGGIVDGRGLAAVLMLGAAGAVMGTRFVASDESSAHPEYKRALVIARQADTIYLADLFDVDWPNAPHRTLRNSTVRAWEAAGRPAPGLRPREGERIGERTNGSAIVRYGFASPVTGESGNIEAMPYYTGQGVDGVRDILPAASIVDRTVRQAEQVIKKHIGST